jgi:hypothetical protein
MDTSHHSTATFSQLADAFKREMARTRARTDANKTKKQPQRRARSATIRADPDHHKELEKSTASGKRARSETRHWDEPTRSSKRLRGIAPDSADGVDVVARPPKDPAGGDVNVNNTPSRSSIERTVSSLTTSTVPDALDLEWFPQETVPDEEFGVSAAVSRQSDIPTSTIIETSVPVLSRPLSCSPSRPTSRNHVGRQSAHISRQSPTIERAATNETPQRATPKPPYTNQVPPPVAIDGHPSLRILFRDVCIFRHNPAEWQSPLFLALIINPEQRTQHESSLRQDGFIRIPTTLFSAASPEDTHFIIGSIYDFCERSALPGAKAKSFADFTDPSSGVLDPRRLDWWITLAKYFSIPDRLDAVFDAQPGEWHKVLHDLHTFALLRNVSEITDTLGVKRARERLHQELARRVASVQTSMLGGSRAKTQFRLMKMGYAELRELSEGLDDVLGQDVGETCPVCVVHPRFKGDPLALFE